MLGIHRQATDYAHGQQGRMVAMAVQKLGAEAGSDRSFGAECRADLEARDDEIEQAKTYAEHMLELKQISALPDFATFFDTSFVDAVEQTKPERARLDADRHARQLDGRRASRRRRRSGRRPPMQRSVAAAAADRCSALAFPLLLLAFWHFATVDRPGSLIPPPHEVWPSCTTSPSAASTTTPTAAPCISICSPRSAASMAASRMALIVALPLGMLIGRVPLVRQLLDPTLQLLRPMPVTAWLPLAMIIFGLGPRSAFFLVFLGAFYPILLNTIFGVRSVDPRLFEAAAMLGCSGHGAVLPVVLPAALPSIFTGLRLGLGFAWVVIVVGEMTGVQTGSAPSSWKRASCRAPRS